MNHIFTYLLENLNHDHPTIKYSASWSAKEVIYLDTRVYRKMAMSRLICRLNPQTGTSTSAWMVVICNTAKQQFSKVKLYRICLEEENLLKRTLDLKEYLLRRGYSKQLLNRDIQHALDTPREVCLRSIPNQEKFCSHTFGSYIPPFFTIPSVNYQMTSLSSSCFRATTRGIFNTTTYCLSLSEKFEGSPGMGVLDTNVT